MMRRRRIVRRERDHEAERELHDQWFGTHRQRENLDLGGARILPLPTADEQGGDR